MSKFQECLDSLKLTTRERNRLQAAHSSTLGEHGWEEYKRGKAQGLQEVEFKHKEAREQIKAELLDAIAKSVLGELFYAKLVKMLDDTRDC